MLDSDDYSSDWTYRDRLFKDLRDGAVAGLLGGGSIMILCLGTDALFFKPLATPDFLAKALIGREALGVDIAVQLRVVRIMIPARTHGCPRCPRWLRPLTANSSNSPGRAGARSLA